MVFKAAIVIEDERFMVIGRDLPAVWRRWQEIERITAFKQDLVTSDRVCMAFEFASGIPPLTIDEDMPGFDLLDRTLAANLPLYDVDWRAQVVLPAFEPGVRAIYTKRAPVL